MITVSCEKDVATPITENAGVDFDQFEEIPYGPGETQLGQRLPNPFNVDNMRRAAELIGQVTNVAGEKRTITATHRYLKLFPRTGEQYVALMEFAEANELNFELQPHDYEVLYNGADGYVDRSVPAGSLPPLYGAVPIRLLSSRSFPRVNYTVEEELYFDPNGYATPLTYAAFAISGNARDYEAVNGLCHPDCPNWPACLDAPELTCKVNVQANRISTLKRVEYGVVPANFPAYVLDNSMGRNGQIPLSICDDIINRRPTCSPGSQAVLQPVLGQAGSCQWVCVRSTDPPPTNNSCNCRSTSPKRPGGKILLEDTQLGDEGVRRIKVRTARYRWGFIWTSTDTNDDGCWNINKTYDIKRAKVQVVFKDRVSDRAVIRSFRGVRAWNAFLEAVDFTWYLTRNDKRWNNLCLRIEDDSDNTSLQEQTFVAATTNNAIHEFYSDHSSLPSPGKTHFLIHTLGGSLNAAPMFRRMDRERFSIAEALRIDYGLAFGVGLRTGLMYTYWDVAQPDVFISFGDNDRSDRKKSTVYHEMAHVSQYARLGRSWWRDFVTYMARVYATSPQFPRTADRLYGDGSLSGSGRPEVAEGLAYAIGNFMTGQQYGIRHSLPGTRNRNQWARFRETGKFHEEDIDFIPEGLFFDLLDSPSFPTNLGSNAESFSVNDQVSGISFERQYEALNSSVVDIASFKARLLARSIGSNSQNSVNTLFASYGH